MVIRLDRSDFKQDPERVLFQRPMYLLHLPRFNDDPVVHRSSTEHRITSSFHVFGEFTEHRLPKAGTVFSPTHDVSKRMVILILCREDSRSIQVQSVMNTVVVWVGAWC
jgi:hypothetical protein